jgi:hypothetical protein
MADTGKRSTTADLFAADITTLLYGPPLRLFPIHFQNHDGFESLREHVSSNSGLNNGREYSRRESFLIPTLNN